MSHISGGDRLGGDEVEILGVFKGRPVHRARKHDLTVDDHRLAVGEPNASVDPDRHPPRANGSIPLPRSRGVGLVGDQLDVDASLFGSDERLNGPDPMVRA